MGGGIEDRIKSFFFFFCEIPTLLWLIQHERWCFTGAVNEERKSLRTGLGNFCVRRDSNVYGDYTSCFHQAIGLHWDNVSYVRYL